jgi:hypothetical protein
MIAVAHYFCGKLNGVPDIPDRCHRTGLQVDTIHYGCIHFL